MASNRVLVRVRDLTQVGYHHGCRHSGWGQRFWWSDLWRAGSGAAAGSRPVPRRWKKPRPRPEQLAAGRQRLRWARFRSITRAGWWNSSRMAQMREMKPGGRGQCAGCWRRNLSLGQRDDGIRDCRLIQSSLDCGPSAIVAAGPSDRNCPVTAMFRTPRLDARPLAVEDRIPRCIPVASLVVGRLPEDPLEGESPDRSAACAAMMHSAHRISIRIGDIPAHQKRGASSGTSSRLTAGCVVSRGEKCM